MRSYLLTLLLFTAAALFAQGWPIDTLPVSELKPGMKGTGRTVFYGDQIEEFQVEIIDVIRDYYPDMDIVLVRLLGERAEQNGVVSGMSGSPVYIDGKLIGAIAYSFGQFMKEPIAGVMPISSMYSILDKEKNRPARTVARPNQLDEYMTALQTRPDEGFWRRVLSMPNLAPANGVGLSRISTPLVFSGFQPNVVGQFAPLLESMGFVVAYGGAGTDTNATPKFEPGSAVSVALVTGDYSIEATGTVTAVYGDRLLAFGHQLFNFGPIRLPLAGSRIYATLPSLMASTKMATGTRVVGTFLQDRLSGALGDLSVEPKMIPVTLQLESPVHPSHTFHFRMADDPAFNNLLPFYLRIALIQAMNVARLAGEQTSAHLTGAVILRDGRRVELDDVFSYKQSFGFLAAGTDAVEAADLVTALLGTLMVNDFKSPGIDRIELKIVTTPEPRYAIIESVWQDKTVVKPGDDLTLTVRLRDNHEEIHKVSQTIKIPKNVSGKLLTVFVAGNTSLTRYEMQTNREKFVPRSFDHLLSIVEKRRKPQNLYIQVRARDNGLIVEGEELSDLPPSIFGVLDTRASGGVSRRAMDRVIYESAIPMHTVVSGARRLALRLQQPEKATNNDHGRQTWYY